MPEKLVVGRHGLDNYEGHLSEQGVYQAVTLAPKIRKFLGDRLCKQGMTIIISSNANRAREFAQIIADNLGLTHISHPSLGDEDGSSFMGDWIAKQLSNLLDEKGGYKGAVIITHQDQTSYLPDYLMPRLGGRLTPLPKGWAYGIDAAVIKDPRGKVELLKPGEEN